MKSSTFELQVGVVYTVQPSLLWFCVSISSANGNEMMRLYFIIIENFFLRVFVFVMCLFTPCSLRSKHRHGCMSY